jgi:hypothetical protein
MGFQPIPMLIGETNDRLRGWANCFGQCRS